jgi:NAD(P)H dehydrogenase (quinone)
MLLVTGASGHVGRRVAELLAARGHPLRLMTRTPERAPELPGAEVVRADYAEPATLDAAFAGVEAAFIVSGYAEPGERAWLHGNAIRAAARAGVKHLVYLSFQGASPTSRFPMSRDHYQTEGILKGSGIPFTALRDNLYMDLIPEMFDEQGRIRGPAGQGRVAWVAREEVARAVAAALFQPGEGSLAYDLTGPKALTLAETAARLSALAGRDLRYEEETLEEGHEWRSKLGAPDWEVEIWLGSYQAIAAGELEQTSDAIRRLTGREPYTLEGYFRERPHLLEAVRE